MFVLHGGPGAPGYMEPLARALSDTFRVLEPMQRGSGSEPLTVARHVDDLHQLVEERCTGVRGAFVGHSWGAMLALAYAAEHPDVVRSLVLVGCGTFDVLSRHRMKEIMDQRMDESLKHRFERLEEEFPDADRRLRAKADLIATLYSYDIVSTDSEVEAVDARANRETWDDMVRLQQEGVYPGAFSAIDAPVLMLHGSYDPHPGEMIRAGLEQHLPQLEYHELERCGHYPWREKAVRDEFFAVLRGWLALQFTVGQGQGLSIIEGMRPPGQELLLDERRCALTPRRC